MINKVGTVSLFVEDQQRAKRFWTEKVGLELRADAELYPGASTRWIAVAPEGAETELILYEPDDNWAHYKQVIGKPQAITLYCDDVHAVYQQLQARGVTFTGEPQSEPWGVYTFMLDSEGNQILLVSNPGGG